MSNITMSVSTKSDEELKGFTCYWRIENFTWKPGSDSVLSSTPFRIETLKSNWQIEIRKEENYLTTYLMKTTNKTSCTTVDVSLSILTNSGWMTLLEKSEREFVKVRSEFGSNLLSFEDMEKNRKLYLPQGALTFVFHITNDELNNESSLCLMVSRAFKKYCHHKTVETFSTLKSSDLLPFPPLFEIKVNQTTRMEGQKPKEVKTQVTQTDAITDFKDTAELLKVFSEKQFEFVTLGTSNQKFFVHKAVLCAKSPVFNAMFKRDMMGNEVNSVDIDDIDCETMTSFVKFLHCEPLGELSQESAMLLYYTADKYQVDTLKRECVAILKKGLSIENASDILYMADLHEDEDLKNFSQEYICKNLKAICLSKGWKGLIRSHPELTIEILNKLAQNVENLIGR